MIMAKPKNKDKRNVNSRRRQDWKNNDQLITDKFVELMMRKQKVPSYEDIARELKMDVTTVKRHVYEISFEDRFKKLRLASEKVMMNLLKQAATGKNHQIIRIWMELFEGLGEKKKVDLTSGGKPLAAPITVVTIDEATRDEVKKLK